MLGVNLLVLTAVPRQTDEVSQLPDGFPGHLLLLPRAVGVNLLVGPAVVQLLLSLVLDDGDADPGPALLGQLYLAEQSLPLALQLRSHFSRLLDLQGLLVLLLPPVLVVPGGTGLDSFLLVVGRSLAQALPLGLSRSHFLLRLSCCVGDVREGTFPGGFAAD